MSRELTPDELKQLPKARLIGLIISFRSQLQISRLRLALAKIAISEYQASIKEKANVLRNLLRRRKSLKKTVKRRRKINR